MSNCENVLDNWEDLDEGLNTALSTLHTSSSSKSVTSVDSIASKLSEANHKQIPIKRDNQTTMKILQRSSKQDDTAPTYTRTTTSNAIAFNNSLMNSEIVRVTTKKLEVMSTNFNPLTMVLHKTEDEYQSANYTAPTANQTVKILRRPTQSTEPRNIDVRPKQPLKSLKQREQEYAEARLRILGSAKNPEDECPSLNVAQPNSCVLSTNNSTANAASKNNSPRSQSGPNTYNNLCTYQQLQLQQKQHTSQLPLQTQKPQQQQSPPPASTQLQQYQQNFHSFNPKNYYYTLQQQQQQQSIPAYNNNRTKSMPLLGHTPNNMLTGGGLGKAQYQPQSTMFTKYQQQQQQQQQQLQQTLYHHKSLQNQNQQQKPQQSWSPVVGGKVSYTTMRQKQQQQQLQQPEPVLRLPRGPDGSNGFQIRR